MLYVDWASKGREKSKARVHWVCGSEDMLREITLDDVKLKSGSESDARLYLDASEGIGRVWDVIRAVPYRDRPSLVVVRHAERLTRDLQPLGDWLKSARTRQKQWLVFIAQEDDWPTDRATEAREASQLLIVRCMPIPTLRLSEVARDWLRPLEAPKAIADAIVLRAGGDLTIMRQICFRLVWFGDPPTAEAIELAWPETPGSAYLRYLIAGKKDRAATAARMVEDPLSVLRLLEWTLDVLARINRSRARGSSEQSVRYLEGLPHGSVERYGRYAVSYDVVRVRKDTALLSQAYRHLSLGRVGVLELVALLW